MAKFIEFDNKMFNTNLIARTGFYDNTTGTENAGVSIIWIYFMQSINGQTEMRFEYVGAERRKQARIDYEKLKKDLKNT